MEGNFKPQSQSNIWTLLVVCSFVGVIFITATFIWQEIKMQDNISVLTKLTAEKLNGEISDNKKDWRTYENTKLGFYMLYPSNYKISIVNDSMILFTDDKNNAVLKVQYRLEAADGSLNTWFNTNPVADIIFGNAPGKQFNYRYCDGTSCGPETVAYVIQHRGKLLGLELIGDYKLDEIEKMIINRFYVSDNLNIL